MPPISSSRTEVGPWRSRWSAIRSRRTSTRSEEHDYGAVQRLGIDALHEHASQLGDREDEDEVEEELLRRYPNAAFQGSGHDPIIARTTAVLLRLPGNCCLRVGPCHYGPEARMVAQATPGTDTSGAEAGPMKDLAA